FPNNQAEINEIKRGFYNIARFPGCIGALDCTHVKIQSPVGDSGYPIKRYLITPLGTPVLPAEQLFNESQIRTRNPVERSYGVWKRRFPVLALGIRLKRNRLEAVIIATAVLHNIACHMSEPDPPIEEEVVRAV
ncbi:unnamed protein product, partial [Tenebrio molitor]